jgi:hypothetical protein
MADIEKYLSLVPSFNRNKPKFRQMLQETLQPFVDAQNFIAELPGHFDVDVAIGVQLDVVGDWVGVKRRLPIPLQNFWFSWDTSGKGWDYGVWEDGDDLTITGIVKLGDDDYRALIKAKIAANGWNALVPDGQTALDEFFAGQQGALPFIQDRKDLTMAICVAGKVPSFIRIALLGGGYIKLKPAAIQAYYFITSVDEKPLFGFDMQNAYVSGWGIGAWGVSPEYVIEHNAPVIPRADFSLAQNGWMLAALGMA